MSERKTTEIKLRLSPAEKTAWQIAAEEDGVGLSQFIRSCVQGVILATEWNRQLGGLKASAPVESLLDSDDFAVMESFTEDEDSSVAPKTIPTGTQGRLAWVDQEPYSSMKLVDYSAYELARAGGVDGYRLELHAVFDTGGETSVAPMWGYEITRASGSLTGPVFKGDALVTPEPVPTSGEADRVTRAAQPQIQRGSHQVGTKPFSALRQPKPWTFEARKSG